MLTYRFNRFFRFFHYLNLVTLKDVIVHTGRQRLPGLAAEIAFNATLSAFPAIVAMLTVVGLVGSSQETFEQLIQQLSRIAPNQVLELIERFVHEISQVSSQSLLSISFVAALWVASGAASAAMSALDQIHQIPPHQTRPFWKAKLVSLELTIGTILLLILASTLVLISDLIVKIIANQSDQIVETIANRRHLIEPGLLRLWQRLSMPIALGMVAIAFAFIYRFGPSRWSKGTPILPGAILATVFWAIFSGLFRLYVANFGNYNRVYGAVGTIIVLLLWLQLGALTMLIGAQLNVIVGKAMRRKKQRLANSAQDRQDNASKN
ncbi:MAG: YihY/virulence factor BrkB family protein [Leptolyngbyaceae cyanobacterium RU_5_1]|nr:YihY/virulence factor BrkB family protein [Leptolyngbyaceae cyanobacterium RU_5_1]